MNKLTVHACQIKLQGFTLTELLVVVTIVAILAATAMPNYRSFIDSKRLVGAVDAIYSQLQAARSESIKQSSTMTVVFSQASSSQPWSSVLQDASNTSLNVVNGGAFEGITLESGFPTSISFDGTRGTTGTDSQILLQSALNKQLQIDVNPIGRVRLCSPTGSESVGGYPSC